MVIETVNDKSPEVASLLRKIGRTGRKLTKLYTGHFSLEESEPIYIMALVVVTAKSFRTAHASGLRNNFSGNFVVFIIILKLTLNLN